MDEREINLQKNLKKWSVNHPQAAIFISYADCSHLEFCQTSRNELNLKQTQKDHNFFYHSNQGALLEAEALVASLDLKNTEVLLVYGIGMGYLYLALKPWLKKSSKHRVIFLEDDLAVLKMFFETEIARTVLKDKKVLLQYFDDLEATHSPLSELYWQFMTLKLKITALPIYAQLRNQRYQELSHKLVYDATMRDAILDEYLKYGVNFFRNFYLNMLGFSGGVLGSAFFGQFKDVPAIICGAGPSLDKHFNLLREVKDRALIFAGGSALNALQSAGLKPHFGAGIDPNPEQEKRLQETAEVDIPFFYRNRLFHEAFRLVKGKKLYIPGSGGYQIASWFDQKFAIQEDGEELDEGFNVANFCISIAQALGCSPIILIGMDLAYTGMSSYAKGVVKQSKVDKEQITEGDDLDELAIERPDLNGEPVYTLWKWIAESQWIGEFASEHPEVEWINATEGGIWFPHIPNQAFQLTVERLKNIDRLDDRIAQCIQKGDLSRITTDKLIAAQKELSGSLERCEGYIQALIEYDQRLIEQISLKKAPPGSMQGGEHVLAEIELENEPAYAYVLEIFNKVYSKVLQNELKRVPKETNSWKNAIKQLKIDLKRLAFLKEVAHTNAALIRYALATKSHIVSEK